jgi:glycosyltransferase involved in cell wall biosynthesis
MLARLVTDRLVVITEQQRREINERFKVGRPEQFAVIPLGIDLDLYGEWQRRREQFREQLRAGADTILVGIVGRLTEIKNHELFFQAAAQFRKGSQSKVQFLVIGDGHLRSQLERLVAEYGLRDQVLFLGSRNDPENFYPALDVLALTSRNEGTPLSVIEGLANARPVVATMVGGVSDLLGDRVSDDNEHSFVVHERGIGVANGDSQSFAQALDYLIENEALRHDLGRRGQAFVLKNYAKARLLADISALYAELLKDQSAAVRGLNPTIMLD